MSSLTHVEIAVLIAIVRLERDAYGVAIRDDIEGFLGKPVSLAAVYAALARLERRILLRTRRSAPLAMPGGRSKRLYELTASGRSFLRHEQREATRLWQALPASARRVF
jgi:PadR family transcriptional regulator PadR